MTAHEKKVLSLKKQGSNPSGALSERLQKCLANAGLGSRRNLEKRIADGEVKVNGQTAEIGNSVRAGDRVQIDERQYVVATDHRDDAQVLAYNKAEGVLTTRDDPEGRPTVFDDLPDPRGSRWIAVGRLDVNTTGLLLLTTDGELANGLMHPSSEVDREYLCRVHGEVSDADLKKLRSGIQLDDGEARFEQIITIDSSASHAWYRVVIREGRNREVRRMWEALECQVSRLKRIRYGCISLPRTLKRGDGLALEAGDVSKLRKLAGIDTPSATLTLKPVSHQRRAKRRPAPIKAESRSPSAWTGGSRHEARELSAWDRPRPESNGRRGKPGSRPGGRRKDVNGNVLESDRSNQPKRRKSRRKAAPGQELPSVRSWFAGDDRNKGKAGKPRRDGKPSGNRRPGNGNGNGKPHGSGKGRGRQR